MPRLTTKAAKLGILQPFRGRKKPTDAQKQSRTRKKKSPDGAPPLPAEPTL